MIRPAPVRRGVSGFGTFTFGHITGGPFFNPREPRFHHHHFHHAFLYAFPYYYEYWNPYYSFGPYAYDLDQGASTYTALDSQIGQLDSEVQELRDENESLRDEVSENRAPATPVAAPSAPNNEAPTILVFNDGHKTEVKNYAVVGQTLWILSDARATKVPLADLNIDQTIKTNEDRGVEFLVPALPKQ
jgi:hypothetical protein